jgi:hypothetical protein
MNSEQRHEYELSRGPALVTKASTVFSIIGILIFLNSESIFFLQYVGAIFFVVGSFVSIMLERKTEYRYWPLKVIGIGGLLSLVIAMFRHA